MSGCDLPAESSGPSTIVGESSAAARDLIIYRNPYGGVDWSSDHRLKAQHHDHVARAPWIHLIPAYDAAGYDVLSLMDYSGRPSLWYPLRERPWPPERWISQPMLAGITNIKLFIPSAEEIGFDDYHVISTFLTHYIEVAPVGTPPSTGQYSTRSELLGLVQSSGGLPCLAHPFAYSYAQLQGIRCAEMYSAFAEAARFGATGSWPRDHDANADMLAKWDEALAHNQDTLGIAVNDHFGPGKSLATVPAEVFDSGKIIVLAKAVSLGAYREAFERGAFFAIRDRGIVKDRYPTVFSISTAANHAHIEADGNVTWVTAGAVVSDGPVLPYSDMPPNTKYVRAEVTGADGSVVYTQAFVVRPRGDSDGDYDVDSDDEALCHPSSGETELVGAGAACH